MLSDKRTNSPGHETDSEILYEKLRISDQQFRGAFEHAPIGMAIVGLDGKWIQVNKSLSKMLGYRPAELMRITFQDLTHPEDLNKDLNALNKLVNGKKDTYEMEKRYFHKDGSTIYAILSVSIVRDQFGEPLHFVSQIIDITNRKKTEDHVKMIFEVTNDQNKRLMNFAQIVSHNLRSHSGNLNMLIDFMKTERDENARTELLSMFEQATSNLEATISHLAEVVSMNHSLNDGFKVANLKTVVDNTVGNVHALLKKVDGRCQIELNPDSLVNVIPAYLDSTILNLLTNAIKYRSDERRLLISITEEKEDNFVLLSIRDNGSGIDLEKNGNKIFGMYKTFHANKDARGIGLFITKNQVEAMGGKILVESVLGQGSTFKVYFRCDSSG
ncbi:histidine kinase [Pedobacter sp. KBW06]|uniref:sensor histidine kinase n=1 Tax=Pedobacter sp. KBW06 TaxID=2153359 RepID=UPI000F5A4E7C|nr:HAMP domain-containing sensor histidine kinase [Pedobacter sp. KBW06]RQO69400.1 histidine kinase [Pedobacter sp. KBW06]